MKKLIQNFIPSSLIKRWHKPKPIQWHNLRRLTPISSVFGFDRGKPIDRHYIEQFLTQHTSDIQGRVLEIGDNTYTRQFGGNKITQSDVLHAVDDNPQATIIADLSNAPEIPSNTFDCIICTQTLPFIYDVRPAIKTLHRILKPEGILLLTVPGISQISRYDMDRWGDYWRFTSLSSRKLLEEVFMTDKIIVKTHGNVLVATAFLQGLATEDLTIEELVYHDPDYEVLITIKAIK